MQAVGRIGSYITKSVYTVSGPFHPFGGAVDIIVVEQPDGSYKSSPWYVRFGKFQGVLKSKEKIVNISVNDVDADFHMYLDHKGEAFFLSEVDEEGTESAFSPPSSSGEDMEGQPGNRWSLKSKSCNFDSNLSASVGDERKALTRANSRRSQFLGLVFGRRSASEEDLLKKENSSGVVRSESLELAEFTADLFDLKWSTNLDSPKTKGKVVNGSLLPATDSSKDEKIHVDGCSHDENDDETKCFSEYVVKTTTTVESFREDVTLPNSELVVSDNGKSDIHVSSVSFVSEVAEPDWRIQESIERLNVVPEIQQCLGKEDQFSFVHEETTSVSGGTEESIVTECYSQLVCLHKSNGSLMNGSHMEDQNVLGEKEKHETSEGHLCNSVPVCTESQPKEELLVFGSHMEDQNVLGETDKHETSEGHLCNSVPVCTESQPKEELLVFGDLDGLDTTDAKHNHSDNEGKEADSVFPSCGPDESSDSKCFSLENSIINDYLIGNGVERTRLCTAASDACIHENGDDNYKGLTRMARSLPSIGPLSGNLEASDLSQSSYPLMYPGVSSDSNKKHRSPGDRTSAEDVAILEDSKEEPAKPSLGSEGNWSAPLRRSRGRKVSHVDVNGCENPNGTEILNNSNYSEKGTDVKVIKKTVRTLIKKTVRTLTPTSEQLASLNLKEGKNVVVFTFSTSMLGNQQVDARIFLWRWDTRIVISDVDGTITRSDLLGQVMPLVGMDWSQTGVAHLFSAIKENGYQLLFLSARSISQSFITRQFLFSIKQDGKALPDGPVVISPDGLFPSLFREVVRRAPHEFKIACLEDIKALFPPDQNPFYAGFGNRDTDEFSYLKVGIPRGKIFIINPKGEIAVARRVDTKNYLALHALVHGMFPTVSTCEQEDFNSWNYWKLPPPMMDL